MHPFRWVPADGERHATGDARLAGAYTVGEQIDSLCGRSVTVAERTEIAWLWETCVDCNREAHRLVGAVQAAER
ncbi:zinc finger protein [Saccharopolyspora shandongensis]|uniref:zinc finger protein n=1 Tax=Saccharopolyspora shandongensis TaxID=418495 RepID=UPI00340865D7